MTMIRPVVRMMLVACAAVLAVAAMAQSEVNADNIVSRLDSRMAALDSMIFRVQSPVGSPDFLRWSASCTPDSTYQAALNAVSIARVKALKAETGLQLTGQTYYRPGNALGLNDEGEGVSRYTGKVQVEARWYFLQSGLLHHRGRIDEIALKAEIDRIQHERGRTAPDLYVNRERLRMVSDSVLASVLTHRIDNLTLLEKAYMYLLDNENVSSDNLLRILDDRAEAERRLSTIALTPVRASGLESVAAGTMAIDTAALLSAVTATDIDLKIIDLKSRLLDRQAGNTTWWSDVRLAPFVRYSLYFRPVLPSSSNFDMGLSFTIPLNTEAAHQRKVLRAEKGQLDCERSELLSSTADKVRYLVLETERLNGAIVGEWERAVALRRYLKARRDAYSKRNGEYNRLSALMEYNSYLRCLENIVEIQYRRDSRLADIQALVPSLPLINYCMFTPLTL